MDYFDKADLAITICDKEGKIIEMNEQSRQVNLKPGQGSHRVKCFGLSPRAGPLHEKNDGGRAEKCLHNRERRDQEDDLPDTNGTMPMVSMRVLQSCR